MTKKIMMSALIIGMVAALVGAGTYALFTDTAASKSNALGAGTLDLQVDGSDTVEPMSITGVAPGDDSYAYHYKWYLTTNAGSVPGGKLTFKIDDVKHDGGDYPAPEKTVDADNSGDLGDVATIAVRFPDSETLVGEYTLAELEAGITVTDDFQNAVTSDGGPVGIELDTIIPATAGNEIMGDAATFNGHLTLEQATP